MPTDRDHAALLAQLQAQLADQQAQIAAQRADFAARLASMERPRRRLLRGFLPLAFVALFVALMPLATFAAGSFNDLTGGVHDANIQAIYDAGITKGCVPNVSYCPTANVTREEMASFLARTAGLGDNPPVANAKTAQTVGGLAPSGLVRVARKSNSMALALTSSYQTYSSPLTITAPAAGFLQVNATLELRVATGAGCPCQIAVYMTNQSVASESVRVTVPATDDFRVQVPLVWVFAATPGANAIDIQVARISGSGAVQGYYSRSTALYVPFGSTGGSDLSIGDTPSVEKP